MLVKLTTGKLPRQFPRRISSLIAVIFRASLPLMYTQKGNLYLSVTILMIFAKICCKQKILINAVQKSKLSNWV